MGDDPREQFEQTRQAIRDQYVRLLESRGSRLVDDSAVREQLLAQVDSVVEAAFDATAGLPPGHADVGLKLSADIGRGRAASGVHPSQSLLAASLIFEAALPVLADVLTVTGLADPQVAAGLALNRAIMSRMSVAADFYVGYLLTRIHNSNHDERRRMSRDLHDLVAPTIALGLQSLVLFDLYHADEPVRAAGKLEQCRASMYEALAAIRSLAAQTKESVTRNGLAYGLQRALESGPSDVKSTLEMSGDDETLPELYREELFLIVREAIRNAFQHAQASVLQVRVTIDDYEVVAAVSDDGVGLSAGLAHRQGLGLSSMRERAELLSGRFAVTGGRRAGTTMTVTIPLPPGNRRTMQTADEVDVSQ